METRREHITQIEQNLEYMSALVLILKKRVSLLHSARINLEKILNLCIYTKSFTTKNHWTSYNI
jgi:hemerythrin-like domain-containing protein